MCQIASDDGGTVIPFFANFVYARTKKVAHGPNLAAAWELDGGRGYHRWWFA
jgi:peptide/nickel transport system substrate-binding protein